MKSYGQYCPVAKALEVIGDRWSLLIIRELLLRGACRYTDLRNGLPGIATNLLVERLRDLEEAGVIKSEAARPPVATTLFSLTARGAALEPVIIHLGLWGAPLMFEDNGGAQFQGHWLGLPLRLHLADKRPGDPPAVVEFRVGGEVVQVRVDEGEIEVLSGWELGDADVHVSGPVLVMMALVS